jgi:DNA-binding CsgD family transcriptional regulator
MHHVFQRFVEGLNDSQELDAFQRAMAEAAAAFELPCFAYLRMPRDGQSLAALMSTYPVQWTDHYLKEHYEKLDPVILQAHAHTEPFEWGLGADNFALTSGQKGFFDAAGEFGIRCGFTIPIQDRRGPIAAVTFASDIRRPEFQRSIKSNQRALQLMAISLHAHVRRKLWRDPVINGVRLSPREMECLRWAAAGKTAWAIGTILGISEHTATFHLANAREKLGVENLRQAVALYARAATQI